MGCNAFRLPRIVLQKLVSLFVIAGENNVYNSAGIPLKVCERNGSRLLNKVDKQEEYKPRNYATMPS
jgi:hypothetical protein